MPEFNDVPSPAPPFDQLDVEQRVLRAATASASQQQQADDDLDPRILAEVCVPLAPLRRVRCAAHHSLRISASNSINARIASV